MRISYSTKTNTLGPGVRYAIWFQGCNKRCVGCINPEGQKLNGGYEISVEQMLNIIMQQKEIVGVTISGGEPFLQFEELKKLILGIKSDTSLDIMLYSGYTLEYLKKHIPESMELLGYVDIFVDGEFEQSKNDNSMFKGSSNQQIYYFTDKYRIYSKEIEKSKIRKFSFEVKKDGEVFFVGIPPEGFYKQFIKRIGGSNYEWKKGI